MGSKTLKIGLALGSGGPRGLAHIGVIKVLEKNNIPINFIAGSSIGAMVGGAYAALRDIQKIEDIALATDWRLIVKLIDPSLRQGLIGGNKVKKFIESHVDKIHFQDLKIPLSVIATDLKSGDTVCINEGEVASAIRASISFPLVFKPKEVDGKLLTDGGLSLPVPVDTVRNMGAEVVIAVNLDNDYFTNNGNTSVNFGYYRIANNSINLLRHHLAALNVQNADLVVNPSLGNINWSKFLNARDAILAGENAMARQLDKLLELL